MFVGPSVKAERWNTTGPQASAYVLDDGSFAPLQPIDYDGNLSWWRTVDLRSLRQLIDETTAR
jgi:hypothetical protein